MSPIGAFLSERPLVGPEDSRLRKPKPPPQQVRASRLAAGFAARTFLTGRALIVISEEEMGKVTGLQDLRICLVGVFFFINFKLLDAAQSSPLPSLISKNTY